MQLLEKGRILAKVISISKQAPVSGAENKTFEPKMLGVARVPQFAAQDFVKAAERFFLASSIEEATSEEYLLALKDRAHYRELLAIDADILSQDDLDAFILLVTGYPRHWLASWTYMERVKELMASNDRSDAEKQEALDACYVEAISVF